MNVGSTTPRYSIIVATLNEQSTIERCIGRILAVYPQGYGGRWNDCNARGQFAARTENVDDVGFLQAVVDRLVKDHDAWSPWMRKDPSIVKQYRGTDGTVGFVQSWSGNKEVGVGEQEIKNISEGSRIDYELRSQGGDPDMRSARNRQRERRGF